MARQRSDFKFLTSHFRLGSLLFAICLCDVGMAALRGGCAKIEITPPLGITLIGSKGQPSDAIRDGLFAKAMVLSDGTTTLAVVSADLLYTPLEDITNPVRTLVHERTGIPAKNVMVCATHTHSGPEVFTRSKVPSEGRLEASRIDQSYCRVLVSKIADSVQLAHRNMQDVRIGAAVGSLPEFLFNRRPRTADGQVRMAFTVPEAVAATRRLETDRDGRVHAVFDLPPEETAREFGPIDPAVLAFRMEDPNGRLVGSLVGFGCHPVCIYPFLSTTISADYPGVATHVVEQAEGGTSLFLLGLAGNAVPLRRDAKPCEQLGKALGGEALKRLQTVAASSDVTLRSATKEISLPCKADANTPSFSTEVQVLTLGDIHILGLPGEILVEVGLAIKDKSPVKNLFIVTLANDVVGYVPHRQAYREGGYEPGPATLLAEGAGEILVEQALALLSEISKPQDVGGAE